MIKLREPIAAILIYVLCPLSAFASDPGSEKSGWDALKELQDGSKRFAGSDSKHQAQNKEASDSLVGGQKPYAIVLSCSDSRVPPELIFDQGLGQIFTVRTAGEVADAAAVASIEYALEHLGARLLVVMGHDSCGAVKAALTVSAKQSDGSRDLDSLLSKIRPGVEQYKNTMEKDPTLGAPVKAHVSQVVRGLVRRSHIIREFIEKDKLVIAHAIYRLSSRSVEFWGLGTPLIFEFEQKRKISSHESEAEPKHAANAQSSSSKTSAKKIPENKPKEKKAHH